MRDKEFAAEYHHLLYMPGRISDVQLDILRQCPNKHFCNWLAGQIESLKWQAVEMPKIFDQMCDISRMFQTVGAMDKALRK
jgi:hypothetical protein